MGSVVQDKYEKGCYYVDGQTWQVGTRYTLLKVLGSGSFSSVVAAVDNDTQEKVALKRIPDVLTNAENAKRVLREVCILRRLSHPHIISLHDVFLKPSSTGRYMYKGGQLVPTSLDLYLALEYCDQGDLFHMRGQLSEAEVKVIMLQLLSAVQYLHRNGVWHRDIKSANILMTYTNGQRHIKLADLGSARSVLLEKCLKGGSAAAAAGSGGGSFSSFSSQHHQHLQQQQQHLGASRLGACSNGHQHEQQHVGPEGEGFMSHQATQTSGSLGGAAPAGAAPDSSPQLQRGSQQQQQQQQEAGACLSEQQQRLASNGGKAVAFGEPATGSAQQHQQQQQPAKRGRLVPTGPPVHHSDSFLGDSHHSPSDIYARPVAGGGGGFKAPLTRMVCTPCYRAPEVVMSRGGYTESIDMWGCGCVFGELLQRVAWIGKATTPQLQVAPVFAIHGAVPQTPTSGERFEGPGNSVTRTELAALFAVIGTPSWRCIESVANPAWRRYLRKITGRAPTLIRRFGPAGEVAIDLLGRLLTFDPVRRCSSEEAIAHEYFGDIRKEALSSSCGNLAALLRLSSSSGGDLPALCAGAAEGEGVTLEDMAAEDLEVCDATLDAQGGDEDMQEWEGFRSSDNTDLAAPGALQSKQQQAQQQQQASSVLKRPRDSSSLTAAAAGMQQSCEGPDPFLAAAAGAGAGDGAAAAANGRQEDEAMDVEDSQQQRPSPPAAPLPPLPPQKAAALAGGWGASGGTGSFSRQQQTLAAAASTDGSGGGGAAAAGGGGALCEQASLRVTPSGQHYYELDDPAAALAALEHDMAALMTELVAEVDAAPGGPPPQAPQPLRELLEREAPQPLRELLEREVLEHISHLDKRRKEATADRAAGRPVGITPSPPGSPLLLANPSPSSKRPSSSAHAGSIRNQWQHLQPDPGRAMDPSHIGYQRLPHHADAEQAHLDPQQHLRAGRHGEWMAETVPQATNRNSTGNVWGVSLVPSGYTEESHPELAAIIKHQHGR